MFLFALTSVVGVGDLAREGYKVQAERSQGRTATAGLNINGPTQPDPQRLEKAYEGIVERYGIRYSTHVGQSQAQFQFPRGVQDVQMNLVDPGYGVIHRVELQQGSWFADDDEQRLAPAVVVSEAFYNAAGRPGLIRSPKVKTAGNQETTIQAELQAQFPDMAVDVNRMDYAAYGDPIAVAQLVVGAIAGLVLLLGAVGMLNISMVTIRYRAREIGIRRSFGATSGRIFVGVMMESLVATSVAGIAGVMVAVAVVKNPWIQGKMAPALSEYPPFRVEAAMLGFGAAVLVGARAGAIPALVAVRIKVIDAIRF